MQDQRVVVKPKTTHDLVEAFPTFDEDPDAMRWGRERPIGWANDGCARNMPEAGHLRRNEQRVALRRDK